MASTFVELMPPTKITTGWELDIELAADLGSFRTLEVQWNVLTPGNGTGGESIVLTHCATKHGVYLTLSGSGIVIDNSAADAHKAVPDFLRFVRARAVGSVSGVPVIGAQIIAKE